jgi:6-pyruvoyltetrahydropterin/6-carboxytetrahydropterin synthase
MIFLMSTYVSTKIIELGSCAFRQWRANQSHCSFVHGYQLKAKFWFGCLELDERNWVVDFGGLKELKTKLQHQFDHTLCIAADDPQLSLFQQLHDAKACDLRVMEKGVGIERTAELCFNIASEHIKELTNGRCWVQKVEVWEHDLNSATYEDKRSTEILTEFTSAPSRGAAVGNQVTTGLGGLFKGTSWG